MAENPMRAIRIEKITFNIGCGGDKEKIEKAEKLLKLLTGQKPVVTLSRKRSTFGIARGKPVGVKVTLRKKKAEEFFKRLMQAKGFKISEKAINGRHINLGFKEYIELPDVKYQHDIGMLGFNATISLERPGFRVERRRRKKAKIGRKHNIYKEEVISWLKERGVEVVK